MVQNLLKIQEKDSKKIFLSDYTGTKIFSNFFGLR
jgi:hypothetical protein